eukprot:CAMPEP_0171886184 /NCGR_PEP_ID=MMETSP0992-20121227/41752_1 /TAXON_ID=483369 /ORGANISM="non described non described, Strain CCMP2098" /LENGTH=39 /DNA_ID= /DNA_START= /DNA_END= /DNA_ORIENTATION=
MAVVVVVDTAAKLVGSTGRKSFAQSFEESAAAQLKKAAW